MASGARQLWGDVRQRNLLVHKNPLELTRLEWKHIRRTEADLSRLIPLGLGMLVVPGSTLIVPLAAVVYPKLLPAPMRSPALNDRVRRDLLRWRQERVGLVVTSLQERLSAYRARSPAAAGADVLLTDDDLLLFLDAVSTPALSYLDWMRLAHYYGVPLWKRLLIPQFSMLTLAADVEVEDAYILRDGLERMSDAEIVEACVERGFVLDRDSPSDVLRARDILATWLHLREFRNISRDMKMFYGPLVTMRRSRGRRSGVLRSVLSRLPWRAPKSPPMRRHGMDVSIIKNEP